MQLSLKKYDMPSISIKLNKVAKRQPSEKDMILDAVKTFLDANEIEATPCVTKTGRFGITKADAATAKDFINAIRKANIFEYVTEVDENKCKFCAGAANLSDGSSISVKQDKKGTYEIIFGTKKSTEEITNALTGKNKVTIENNQPTQKITF